MCIAQKIVDKRSARKAENRIAIMDAAEKLVLAGGLKALTADTLAKESGVSRRTIFNHFSSVEAAAVERLNEYLDRIFEVIPDFCTPTGPHLERDMLDGVRAAFTTERLAEHVEPHARLLFALHDYSVDNKFNEYSSTSYLNSIEMVVDKLWQQRQDIPRMRIAIFGNLIASAVCEGIAASFYDAEGNPQPPENAKKMRENIEHCLDYVEELIDGKYT